MQELGELPVVMVDGRPALDAVVNGKPARMLIDTGSAETMLFRGAAAEMGLSLAPAAVTFYGVGGSDEAMVAHLKSFEVAGLTARDMSIYVVGQQYGDRVQGLIGGRFLTQADVEFDFPEHKLRFFKPKGCSGDQVVYWGTAYSMAPLEGAASDGLFVDVLVNGLRVQAQMDSGSSVSILTPPVASRLGVTPQSDGVTDEGGVTGLGSGEVASLSAIFSSFSFGDETIHNARLRVADMFAANKEVPLNSHIAADIVPVPRMLIGADFFRSHRIYVARDQRRVYVSYVGGRVFDLSDPRPDPAEAGRK